MEGSEEIANGFESLGSLFDQFMKTMTQDSRGAMMAQNTQPNSWLTRMEKAGGLPIMTRMYGPGGNVTQETKILSTENKSYYLSEFSVPKNYKKQKMDMGR